MQRYDGPAGAEDKACDIVLHGMNIYVTGWSVGAGTNFDYATIRYAPNGSIAWVQRYDGPAGASPDYAEAIAVDTTVGSVVVTGRSWGGAGSGYDFATIKYSPTGAMMWLARYDFGVGDDEAVALAIDPAGPIYITGRSQGVGTGFDYAIVKLGGTGVFLWQQRYDGGGGADEARAIMVDGMGNIIVTGSSLGIAHDYATVKYSNTGVLQWIQRYNGPGNSEDDAYSLAVDASNNIYVTGASFGTISDPDYYTIKYNASGVMLWDARYDYAGFGEEALCVVVDNGLNVYVTGRSTNASFNPDWATLKYSQGSSLIVTLTPVSLPIVVPAIGGSFNFTASVVRNIGPQAPFWAWARIKNPDGSYTPPTLGPVQINPPVGITVSRLRTQTVPGTWVPGVYTYLAYANTLFSYPAIDSNSFTFTKSVIADGGSFITEARCYGEPFTGEEMATVPSSFRLIGANPNPFNPITTIRYQMPDARHISLKVYDTAGRLVTTLVDGYRAAGSHEVTFDGSGLASGVYLYTLTAGGQTMTGKLILLK